MAHLHPLQSEMDSGFNPTSRMELSSKTSLKPLFIFVMRPTLHTLYTPPPTTKKEKLAKFYPKTLSHLRLHQLQVLLDSEER